MGMLWAQLPPNSRTAKRQEPSLAWDTGEYLLWRLEYDLRVLIWSLSSDKKRPQPKPEPIPNPAEIAEAHKKQEHALSLKDEMAKEFGLEV